jgi:hypothetical protein
MFGILILSICAVLTLVEGRAPTTESLQAQKSVPTIDQLIEMNISALGGRHALTSTGTLILSGECESANPEEGGAVEIAIHTPKVHYNLGNGALQMGYSGESVWRRTEGEGLRQQPGRAFAELVTVFDPARVLWWKQWYPDAAVSGVKMVGDRQAYAVQTHPGRAGSEVLFVDRESHLVIRDELMPNLVFTYSDYREIQGVQVPFSIKQTGPAGASYSYRILKAARVPDDDSRFQPR